MRDLIRDARKAIEDTGLVRFDIGLGGMVPVDGSDHARFLADAYNLSTTADFIDVTEEEPRK